MKRVNIKDLNRLGQVIIIDRLNFEIASSNNEFSILCANGMPFIHIAHQFNEVISLMCQRSRHAFVPPLHFIEIMSFSSMVVVSGHCSLQQQKKNYSQKYAIKSNVP